MSPLSQDSVKEQLLGWILQKSKKIPAEGVHEETPLIETRILTSLQVMELLLFIERMKGKRLEIKNLKPGAFKDVRTISQTFFGELS